MNIADLPVVILCGGKGRRLGALTATTPKCWLSVAGRPFLLHQLEMLFRRGCRRFIYADEPDVGTAAAVRLATPLNCLTVGVIYGDTYLDIDYQRVLDDYVRYHAALVLAICRPPAARYQPNVWYHDAKLVEYNKMERNTRLTFMDAGFSIVQRRDIVGADLGETYQHLISHRLSVGHEIHDRFYEIGSPEGLAETEAYLQCRLATTT